MEADVAVGSVAESLLARHASFGEDSQPTKSIGCGGDRCEAYGQSTA